MSDASIVVIGNANVDLTTYVETHPVEGATVLGHDFTIGMGGKGANQAVAAARAGGSVSLIGRIGDDSFGQFVTTHLSAEGLDLTHLETISGKTGVASIYVDKAGSNRIAVFPGASGTIDGPLAMASVAAHPHMRYLVSQLEMRQEAVAEALTSAKNSGATTVLNIAPYSPLRAGIIENTDWLIANEVEIADLFRDRGLTSPTGFDPPSLASSLPGWADELGCNVVITLGEQGAIGYLPGEEPVHVPSPAVTAVDTVGAGDCFVGFFVSFMDQGLTWPEALAGGVLAASESVQRPGAQSSYPSRDEAERIIAAARK